MEKLKRILTLMMAISIIAMVYACGGGGDSAPTTQTPTTQTPTVTGSSFVGSVGGAVSTSTDGVGTASNNGRIAKSDTSIFDNTSVTIQSYDDKGNLIDTVVSRINNGRFNSPVKMWDKGGKLVINIKKDGFVEYTKTFEYDNTTKSLDVQAILQQIAVSQVIPIDNKTVTISKSGEKILSIYVVKDKKGVTAVRFGNVKISAGDNVTYKMDIPVNNLDNNLAAIKAEIKNFDPSRPEDMNNFPSERDTTGEKLITAGFDFSNLTNAETGGSIFSQAAVSRVKKSANEALAYVYKYVQCNNLMGDMKPETTDKYDVNVYVLKNNEWKMIGTAYVANSYNDNESKPVNQVCPSDNGSEYMYIGITDPDFKWVNLDYPLSWLSSKTVEKCAEIEFKDDSGNYIDRYISFSYQDNASPASFSSGYGYASNGKGKISVLMDATKASKSSTAAAKVTVYNPYTYRTEDKTVVLGSKDNCTKATFTFTNPLKCNLTGYINDGTKNIPNEYIYIYDNSSYNYLGFGVTNENGYYDVKTLCNTPLKIYYYSGYDYKTQEANINDNKELDEQTDNNSIVLLKTFYKENSNPYGYGYLSTTQRKSNQSHKIYFYAYDYEGDSIEYQIIKGSNVIASGTWSGYNYKEYTDSDNTTGTFTYKLKVKDNVTNHDWKEYSLGSVEITSADENRKPVISYFYGSPQKGRQGFSSNLYFYFYDLDGDNITGKLNGCGKQDQSVNISDTDYSINVNDNCSLTLTVSDGKDNASKTINFEAYENRSPIINYAIASPSSVRIGSSIRLSSYGYDPDGDNLTYSWALVSGNGCTFETPDAKVSNITCNTPGSYTARITYTDNFNPSKSTTRDVTFTYTDNRAPVVNINLSNPTPKPGDNVTITCSATDPDGDSIKSYKIFIDEEQKSETKSYDLRIPQNTPITKVYNIKCVATDDFRLGNKSGEKEIQLGLSTAYGNITITNKK